MNSEPRGARSLIGSVVRTGRVTVGALALVAAAIACLLVVNIAVFEPRIDRALGGTNAARLGHEAMLDQQAGLRGFLLSGDERYLEAYRRGSDALRGHNAEAARLLAGDGRNGELLLGMRLAQQAWIEEWAAEALVRGRDVREGVPAPVAFQRRDKELFDVYRERYDQLITQLVERRQLAIHDQRWSLLLALGLALTMSLLGAALGHRASRSLRRAVQAPLQGLLERLDEIQRGDLVPRQVSAGSSEFQQIEAGLEVTVAALAEAQAGAERRDQQIQAHVRQQTEVLAFAREVSGNLSVKYVLRGVCTHAASVAGDAQVVVWLMDEARAGLVPFADSAGPDMRPVGTDPQPLGEGLVGQAARYGRLQRATDQISAGHRDLAVPMVVGAHVIGVLEFVGPQVRGLSSSAVEVLETLAVHAASAINAATLHERTTEMALTDGLTGLANRRRLETDLERECGISLRHDRPLSFLMVDVDHFKNYNDSFGHQAGDAALQDLAGVLTQHLRPSDAGYRFGGEEFALVLRETDAEEAAALAERLRAAVEHRFGAPGQPRPVTVSIGVASLPGHGPTPQSLTAAADQSLYEAKRAGRNRVCIASSGTAAPRLSAAPSVG